MDWNEVVETQGMFRWPYAIRYGEERKISTDVLVLGGGIAGCWAAISAARKGLKVALVEKAATIRSGAGGAGCDHWVLTPNPLSEITAEEVVDTELQDTGGYTNTISRYIAARESYDTLLELENMGAKVRDEDDEFDRTMATSLLNERGEQGQRVVGATAINVRTGEFLIFKAKATILCLSRPQRIWQFQSELTGFDTLRPQTNTGDGHAIAFKAGAKFTLMEKSLAHIMGSGDGFPIYGQGNPFNTWHPCSMIDAKGNEIPWVDRDGRSLRTVRERSLPSSGQKFMGERSLTYPYRRPQLTPDLPERIKKGEFVLPLYADLPGMPEEEQRVIWGMMVREEGKTHIPIYQTYMEKGFNPNQERDFMRLEINFLLPTTTTMQRQRGDMLAGRQPMTP